MPRELRRINTGWLSPLEQRLLHWLARRLPAGVTPDGLTMLGLAGAVLALLGYVLCWQTPAALWLVNLALVVNWFGDSLDGSVARLRGIERPRYGFYLDQCVDILAQALFALGLALSGYIRPEIVATGLVTFLMISVQSLLYAHATGDFHLATGGFGYTETRCLFFAANTLFYFWPPVAFDLWGASLAYSDILALLWSAANLGTFLAAMIHALGRLAKEDPVRRRKPPEAE